MLGLEEPCDPQARVLGALLTTCDSPVAHDPLACVTTDAYHTLQDTTGCLGNTTAALNRMLHEYEGPTGALGSLECSVGGFFKVRQLRHHSDLSFGIGGLAISRAIRKRNS